MSRWFYYWGRGGKPQATLSFQTKTFANVFIAIAGADVLGFPYTFMRTGWVTSLLMIFFVAALTYRGMMLLIHTRRKLEDSPFSISSSGSGGFPKIASFGDLGFTVCGSVGRFVVDFMIVLSQAGLCVVYLIFITNTLATLFTATATGLSSSSSSLSGSGFVSAKSIYISACFPFQLGLNAIPSLTLLAPLSIFTDIIDLVAMGEVKVDDDLLFTKQMPPVEAFASLSTFFYGLGVAVYSFEGIGIALPLESEMKDKSKFGKILAFTMVFIAAMYGGFGAMGYFAFGPNTKDIITANMGKGLVSVLSSFCHLNASDPVTLPFLICLWLRFWLWVMSLESEGTGSWGRLKVSFERQDSKVVVMATCLIKQGRRRKEVEKKKGRKDILVNKIN